MNWHKKLSAQLSKFGFTEYKNGFYFQWMINESKKEIAILAIDNSVSIYKYNSVPNDISTDVTDKYELFTKKNTVEFIKSLLKEVLSNIKNGSRW